jgi:hypothetical protein
MDVFPEVCEFVCLDHGQAAAENDGLRMVFSGLVEQVTALGRGGAGHRTAIDDKQLRRFRGRHLAKAGVFEKLANLLAFVLIHLAAEC